MKKSAVLLSTIFISLAAATIAFAHHGPETIELNAAQAKMAPVQFNHHKHQDRVEMDCLVCHHTEAKDATELKPCSECHGKVDGAPDYKKAMHTRCQGCHKEQKAAGLNPPLKCTECHVKK